MYMRSGLVLLIIYTNANAHIVDSKIQGDIYSQCSGSDACNVLQLDTCYTNVRSHFVNTHGHNLNYTHTTQGNTLLTRAWLDLTPDQQKLWSTAQSGEVYTNTNISTELYDSTVDFKMQYGFFNRNAQSKLTYCRYGTPGYRGNMQVVLEPGQEVHINDKWCSYRVFSCLDTNTSVRRKAQDNMKRQPRMQVRSPEIWERWSMLTEAPVDFQCTAVGHSLAEDFGIFNSSVYNGNFESSA